MKLKRVLNTAVGQIELHMFITTTQRGKVAFAVMYNDYPASLTGKTDPDKILINALNGAVRSKQGRILERKNLKLDGYPGKQVKLEGSSKGKKRIGYIRVYLVKNRLYQLLAFGQGAGKLQESDVNKFFKSFQRLKK